MIHPRWRSLIVFAGLGALILVVAGANAQQPVWIGISFTVENNTIKINGLPFDSPALRAGLHVGDVIVGMNGGDFQAGQVSLDQRFREEISKRKPGDVVTLRVLRDKVIEVPVTIAERSIGVGVTKTYSAPAIAKTSWPEEQLAESLAGEFKIEDSYKDLRQRLSRLSDIGDRFRLSRLAYIQHEPFQLRTVASRTFDEVAAATNRRDPSAALALAAGWLDAPGTAATPALKKGLTLDQHLDQLVALFQEVKKSREDAFSQITAEDQKFLEDNVDALLSNVSDGLELQTDPDPQRAERNSKVLQIAERMDFVKLFDGAKLLWRASADDYLDDLESSARRSWEAAGKPEGIFIDRDTPIGKIIVGGTGKTWYSEDAAILLDLGGDDFYTNNAGSPRGNKMPVAMLVDFGGDDAYEATFDWTQGAARMGHGMLIDRKGSDSYVGRAWAQGAAALGTALLLDELGNDTYRADEFAQGVAVWGIAIQMDYDGNDRYDARILGQGVGLPGGAGWLLDAKGDDNYYAKGGRQTGYGDVGIFDSWSQGCAMGFRGLQSGGVALLYDGAGKDRYEAGNFSQGGGYYFGIGMMRDAGNDNDVYIASHYGQGFAAHEAVGYFEEMGGNDSYTTRHAVAQSIAWDESITAFIDHAGDDVYEGGASFSQGASAHNGFALFLDLGGRNRFAYSTAQGTAGPNDYHGGTSLSLFVASDDKGNSYKSKMTPSTIRMNGDYGLFVDLPGSIESALKSKSLRKLIHTN